MAAINGETYYSPGWEEMINSFKVSVLPKLICAVSENLQEQKHGGCES